MGKQAGEKVKKRSKRELKVVQISLPNITEYNKVYTWISDVVFNSDVYLSLSPARGASSPAE